MDKSSISPKVTEIGEDSSWCGWPLAHGIEGLPVYHEGLPGTWQCERGRCKERYMLHIYMCNIYICNMHMLQQHAHVACTCWRSRGTLHAHVACCMCLRVSDLKHKVLVPMHSHTCDSNTLDSNTLDLLRPYAYSLEASRCVRGCVSGCVRWCRCHLSIPSTPLHTSPHLSIPCPLPFVTVILSLLFLHTCIYPHKYTRACMYA